MAQRQELQLHQPRPFIPAEQTISAITCIEPESVAIAGIVSFLLNMPEWRATERQLIHVVEQLVGESNITFRTVLARLHSSEGVPGVSLRRSNVPPVAFKLSNMRGVIAADEVRSELTRLYPIITTILPTEADINEIEIARRRVHQPTNAEIISDLYKNNPDKLVYFRKGRHDFYPPGTFYLYLRQQNVRCVRRLAANQPDQLFYRCIAEGAVSRSLDYYIRLSEERSPLAIGQNCSFSDIYGQEISVVVVEKL